MPSQPVPSGQRFWRVLAMLVLLCGFFVFAVTYGAVYSLRDGLLFVVIPLLVAISFIGVLYRRRFALSSRALVIAEVVTTTTVVALAVVMLSSAFKPYVHGKKSVCLSNLRLLRMTLWIIEHDSDLPSLPADKVWDEITARIPHRCLVCPQQRIPSRMGYGYNPATSPGRYPDDEYPCLVVFADGGNQDNLILSNQDIDTSRHPVFHRRHLFSKTRTEGFNALLCDGSVRWIEAGTEYKLEP